MTPPTHRTDGLRYVMISVIIMSVASVIIGYIFTMQRIRRQTPPWLIITVESCQYIQCAREPEALPLVHLESCTNSIHRR